MKYFLDIGNRYLKESDWRDLALIKFCLFSMGLLVGIHVGARQKKAVGIVSAAVFLSTYVVLIRKLIRVMFPQRCDE